MVEEKQGEEDPEGGKARGVPQDLGADDVAVHLLEDDDEDQEDQALPRVGEQQQEGAGDGPEEGPEDRDDVGDPHNDADEGGIGHPQDRQDHPADDADDQGVHELAGDKAAEDLVDVPQMPEDGVAGGAALDRGVEDLFPLAHELIPAQKHIDHDDDADDEVQHALGGVPHPAEQLSQGGQGIVLEPASEKILDPLEQIGNEIGGYPVGGQEAGELIGKALDHAGQALDQGGQADHQLGDDKVGEGHQQDQEDQQSEQGRQGPGRFFLHVVVEQKLLGKPGQGIEQIGHDATHHDGPQRVHHPAQGFSDVADVEHRLDHQEDNDDPHQDHAAVVQDPLVSRPHGAPSSRQPSGSYISPRYVQYTRAFHFLQGSGGEKIPGQQTPPVEEKRSPADLRAVRRIPALFPRQKTGLGEIISCCPLFQNVV